MRLKTVNLAAAILFAAATVFAQDVTTVTAVNNDISENLDLEAVASVFGESEDLEDFERRLNDPNTQISNLDLNQDGEVDYLRVVETSKGGTHLVTIQAVVGDNKYQDVATVDVEKDSDGATRVQVVGDVYLYGSNYIIEPVYAHSPAIYVWFWGPYYHPWHSPYYWGHYPPRYHPWHPYPIHRYHSSVHIHINANNSYRHASVRRSHTSASLHKTSRRNDYGAMHPDKSFTKRNNGAKNKQELKSAKAANNNIKPANSAKPTGKPAQDNRKPEPSKKSGNSSAKDAGVSVPSNKPPTKAAQPKTKNIDSNTNRNKQPKTTKPATKPQTQPRIKPHNQYKNQPQAKPHPRTQPAPRVKPQPQPRPQSKPKAPPRGNTIRR